MDPLTAKGEMAELWGLPRKICLNLGIDWKTVVRAGLGVGHRETFFKLHDTLSWKLQQSSCPLQ